MIWGGFTCESSPATTKIMFPAGQALLRRAGFLSKMRHAPNQSDRQRTEISASLQDLACDRPQTETAHIGKTDAVTST